MYLESYTLGLATTHLAASSTSNAHGSEAVKGPQTLRGRDPRIGKEAAVYVGHMKGYRGRLVDIGRDSGRIECPGRQLTIHTALLKHLVLM